MAHFVRPSPTYFQIVTISLLILVYFNYVLDTTETLPETTAIPAGEFESNAILSPTL